MNDERNPLIPAILRTLFAVIFLAIGIITFIKAARTEGLGGLGIGLIGMGFSLTGAVLIAPVIISLFVEYVGNLFFPTEYFDRPQPMYSVPEAKRKGGLCKEAFEGFLQIAREHQQEIKPYAEMIDIAVVDLKDKKLADEVLSLGQATLKNEEDRAALAKTHEIICSRLDTIPAHDKPPIPIKQHSQTP